MKRLNVFSMYTLSKELFPILQFQTDKAYKYSEILWPLWTARAILQGHLRSKTFFLDASMRAAQNVIEWINSIVPQDIREAMDEKKQTEIIYPYRIQSVVSAIQSLETVMGSDLPGLSCYLVSPKGIYKTEALIENADENFGETIRAGVPERAREDFKEAGRCLAFERPTACAFHLWRAIETVMDAYYLRLTSKSFKEAGVTRNWDRYVKALNEAHAEGKITQFLDHIRKEYRNPQTHPEVMVSVDEAFSLFGVASSVINQMVLEMQKPQTAPQLPLAGGAAGTKPA
jgi:hypothetical protein